MNLNSESLFFALGAAAEGVVAVDLSATAVEAAKTFLSESKSPAASKIEASFIQFEFSFLKDKHRWYLS